MNREMLLQFLITAKDLASPVLTRTAEHIEAVNAAAKSGATVREYSENLGMMGAGALAAGGAMAAGLGYVLKPAIAMQAEMARVREAMRAGEDVAKDAAEAQKKAEELSAKGVISATELAEAYYNARMNGLKHTEALAAMNAGNNLTIATTRNAADAQAQLATTTRTLTTLNKLSGVGADELADQLAALQTRYAELDIGEVTSGLTYAMPVSRQAGIAVNEMNAALALLSMGGMHGEMAGTAYREMIAKLTTKDTLQPFIRKTKQGGLELADTMQALAASMANLTPLARTMRLKELGFNLRDVQGVNILIDRVSELKNVEADLNNSRGEAARLAGVRMSAADEQWANLQQNLDQLRESIGENLIPAVNRLIPRLTAGLQSLRGWVESNKGFVTLALKATALGAAILIPLGTIALPGASLAFIGSYVPVVLKFINPFNWWAAAVKTVTSAQILLNAAMDLNPVVLIVAGVVALGVAAYEMWKHWAAVKQFFKDWGVEVLGFIVAPWAMLPIEIYKHIDAIKSAAKSVAHAIASLFVGHSPIPEGPLHDLNLSREFVRTINPEPIMVAMRRMAMVTALAAPMMVGAGGAPANAAGGVAGGGVVIQHVTIAPRITLQGGGDPKALAREVVAALKSHNTELAKVLVDEIQREQARRNRRKF